MYPGTVPTSRPPTLSRSCTTRFFFAKRRAQGSPQGQGTRGTHTRDSTNRKRHTPQPPTDRAPPPHKHINPRTPRAPQTPVCFQPPVFSGAHMVHTLARLLQASDTLATCNGPPRARSLRTHPSLALASCATHTACYESKGGDLRCATRAVTACHISLDSSRQPALLAPLRCASVSRTLLAWSLS